MSSDASMGKVQVEFSDVANIVGVFELIIKVSVQVQ